MKTLSSHYENTPIQIFTTKKWTFSEKNADIFHISTQNIDYLDEAVRTSTHNLCFWAEIGKLIYTPVNPSFTI